MLDPPIELRKEAAHLRFAREGPPAPNPGSHSFAHRPQFEWSLPLGEPAELLFAPCHAFLAGPGIEVLRVSAAGAPWRRHSQPFALLDLVAEELAAVAAMDNPPLLRMELDPQFLPKEVPGNGPGPWGCLPCLTQPYKV